MRHELGGQIADALTSESALPDKVRPSRKIERYLRLRLIHRQHKPIARNAALVLERLTQGCPERERTILDRVMLIDTQIAPAVELERKAAVLRELLQHVIEEPETRLDPPRRLT